MDKGVRVRKRRFAGFVGEVKANTTLDNCTYAGEVYSMSDNNIDCGSGLAIFSIVPYDLDYKANKF